MGMEKFNPSDEQYKKVEDLPKKQRHKFVDAPNEQGGGFVRKEAMETFEAKKRDAEIVDTASSRMGILGKLTDKVFNDSREYHKVLTEETKEGLFADALAEDEKIAKERKEEREKLLLDKTMAGRKKFDPSDSKYKKIKDLPESVQRQFEATEDGKGFVRNTPMIKEFIEEEGEYFRKRFVETMHMLAIIADAKNGAEEARKTNELLRSIDEQLIALRPKIDELEAIVDEAYEAAQDALIPQREEITERYRDMSRKALKKIGHDGYIAAERIWNDYRVTNTYRYARRPSPLAPDYRIETLLSYVMLEGVVDGKTISIKADYDGSKDEDGRYKRVKAYIDGEKVTREFATDLFEKFRPCTYKKHDQTKEINALKPTISPGIKQKQKDLQYLKGVLEKLLEPYNTIREQVTNEVKEATSVGFEEKFAEKTKFASLLK